MIVRRIPLIITWFISNHVHHPNSSNIDGQQEQHTPASKSKLYQPLLGRSTWEPRMRHEITLRWVLKPTQKKTLWAGKMLTFWLLCCNFHERRHIYLCNKLCLYTLGLGSHLVGSVVNDIHETGALHYGCFSWRPGFQQSEMVVSHSLFRSCSFYFHQCDAGCLLHQSEVNSFSLWLIFCPI